MNKVILMGRLTADPDLRQTQGGISSCRFTIAINRNFVDKNTGQRQADFITCVAWRQTAEFINRYFNKGNMICIEGTLRTGSYADKKHPDVTHFTTDVHVENVEFTGSKSESGQGNYNSNANTYNNNSNYHAPHTQQESQQLSNTQINENMSYGQDGEFQEILSDSDDIPF